MDIQKQMRREKTWHLTVLLIVLTAISSAIVAAFDADSYNESQLNSLLKGDHVVIVVHGIRSRAAEMQKRMEALMRMLQV